MNPESESPNQEAMFRKSYSSPNLIIYGAVRNLTQSGSGQYSELKINGQCWPLNQMGTFWKPCSERRVKENIVRIGDHPLGIGLYLFDYLPEYRERFGHGRQFGVMMDEVERVMPEAVSLHSDGYKRVDHALLGIYQHRH